MTDLRELLREAHPHLLGYMDLYERIRVALAQQPEPAIAWPFASDPPAQPPDAQPVATVVTILQGRNAGKQVQLHADLPNGTKLYAAPQPPAGEGEGLHYTVLLGKLAELEEQWRDIGAICASGWTRDSEARSPNEWAEALLHDRDELRQKLADAIPREIHDRLVRDAKAQALRDMLPALPVSERLKQADDCVELAIEYASKLSQTSRAPHSESSMKVLNEVRARLRSAMLALAGIDDAAMASEHERP